MTCGGDFRKQKSLNVLICANSAVQTSQCSYHSKRCDKVIGDIFSIISTSQLLIKTTPGYFRKEEYAGVKLRVF